MIEHAILVEHDALHVRARRGLPGLGKWRDCGSSAVAALSEVAQFAEPRSWPRLGVRVYVAASDCRVLSIPPVSAVRSLRDYDAIAAHLMQERLGLRLDDWEVHVDPASTAGVVACAIRRAALATANAAAAALKQRLRSIEPWAAYTLAYAQPTELDVTTVVKDRIGVTICSNSSSGGLIRSVQASGATMEHAARAMLASSSHRSLRTFAAKAIGSGGRALVGTFCDLLEEERS